MRILMMGTGPFAVPTFQSLLQSGHEICGLVTRPPAGSHRGKRKDINPMREAAEMFLQQSENAESDFPILDPPSVNDDDFQATLESFQADLFVVCDYGQILSSQSLSQSSLGGINLHGSLLPRYRGAAPINWALYNGDSVTGNTVILMTPKLDGGPILGTVQLEILASDTAVSIEEKLSQAGPDLVLRCIEQLAEWDGESSIGTRQDPDQVTKAPRLKKSDGEVNWQKSARQIFNQVRAFQPWPGSYSQLLRTGQPPLRVILNQVDYREGSPDEGAVPGTVVAVDKSGLQIQTGDSLIDVLQVQPSGKKNMPVADFLRGNSVQVGDRFGAA